MTTLDSNPRYTFDTQLVTEYAPWRRQRLSINRLHERLDTRSYKMLDDAMELAATVLGTYRLPDVATATVSFLTQDSPVFGTWVVTMSRLVDTSDGPTSELLEIAERFSQLSWRLGMT